MSKLKLGVSLPTVGGPDDLDVRAAARHVEDLGLESVWVPDLITGDGQPSMEAVVTLTAAAAVTDRVGVGFGVLVLPARPVATVAAQLATLQQLSGGRVLLGVGTGGFPGTPFWQAAGAPEQGRGRSTDTALGMLPGLLAGQPTRIDPHPEAVTLAPAGEVPPILVGGNADAAIRRAAIFGDGWLPSLIAPNALASRAGILRKHAVERGRAAPGITVGGHAMLGSPEETRPAREEFQRNLVDVHGMPPEQAASIPVAGKPSEVAERLAAYAAAGADRLVLNIDGEHWYRQCELLAEAGALL